MKKIQMGVLLAGLLGVSGCTATIAPGGAAHISYVPARTRVVVLRPAPRVAFFRSAPRPAYRPGRRPVPPPGRPVHGGRFF